MGSKTDLSENEKSLTIRKLLNIYHIYRSHNKRTGLPRKNDEEIFDGPFLKTEEVRCGVVYDLKLMKTYAEFFEQWMPFGE